MRNQGGGERWGRPPPTPLKYKLIYISSQRNSGNRTSEDAMTFSLVFTRFWGRGGELDVEGHEGLFGFGLHRYFQWKRKQEIAPPPPPPPPPLFKFLGTLLEVMVSLCLFDGCVADDEKGKKLLRPCFTEKGIMLHSPQKRKANGKPKFSQEVSEKSSLADLTVEVSWYFFW